MTESLILQKLASSVKTEVEEALYAIGENPPPNAVELILPFLNHADRGIRETAAFSLGEIQMDSAIEPLIKLVRSDADDSLKDFALDALDRYQSPEMELLLLELLDSQVLKMRVPVTLLKDYPSAKARTVLAEILLEDSYNHMVHIPAVDSLYAMNDPSLNEKWEEITASTNEEYVFVIAHKALIELHYEKGKYPFEPTLFDQYDQLNSTLEIFRITVEMNREVEEFLLISLEKEKFDDLFAYGMISINMLIAMIIIEKGTPESIQTLAEIITKVWSKHHIDRFHSYIEGSKLEKRYQEVLKTD